MMKETINNNGIGSLSSLYSPAFARRLLVAYREHDNSLIDTASWFLQTNTYRQKGMLRPEDKLWSVLLVFGWLVMFYIGVVLIVDDVLYDYAGFWAFGTAVLLGIPFALFGLFCMGVIATRVVHYVVHPKQFGKAIVASVLESQVRQLRKRHHVVVIAVAGSVGKTSTKLAIAQLLGQNLRVQYQAGNYNDRVTVPLVFFGQTQPSLFNPFAWMRVFGENTARIEHPYPYDVVVVELGTDAPGQMKRFAYLQPDIAVLTAVAPEHMANFASIDDVAQEELSIFAYSRRILVNVDSVAPKYLLNRTFVAYGQTSLAKDGYRAKTKSASLVGQFLSVSRPAGKDIEGKIAYAGEQGASCALAAVTVADLLSLRPGIIEEALGKMQPFAGRMQVLEGIKNSVLIDDTYNASPVAVKAALDVLYAQKSKHRIAILGSMNELGDYARIAHEEIGAYCDANKLDLVFTIGKDAQRWLAPAARKQGCTVRSFSSPYTCGQYARKHLAENSVILAKGSQNGVFAEEALKPLLAHPVDVQKLVRQNSYWTRIKQKQFDNA